MDNVTPPDLALHWRVRRRTMIGCICLLVLSTIGFTHLAISSPAAMETMGVLIGWYYGTLSIPIVGYYANTGISEFVKNRKM